MTEFERLTKENSMLMQEAAELFDRINAVWADAEEQVRSFGVLKPVQVKSKVFEDGWYFGVQKVQGKWRICLGRDTTTFGDVDWTPMTDSSVAHRTTLIGKIELLYPAIVDSNREAIEDLRKAVICQK